MVGGTWSTKYCNDDRALDADQSVTGTVLFPILSRELREQPSALNNTKSRFSTTKFRIQYFCVSFQALLVSRTCFIKTRQTMELQRNIEARSHNHCCSGHTICITYSECVSVASFSQHAKHMRCIKADSHIACRSHAAPMPCRATKGLECLSHLIYTVRPCLIHTFHAMPCSDHVVLLKATARPCCAMALRRTAWSEHGMGMAWHGMANVNQTRPHCVNQMGKTF